VLLPLVVSLLHYTTVAAAATDSSIADKNRLNAVNDRDELSQWGPYPLRVSTSAGTIPRDIAADQHGR